MYFLIVLGVCLVDQISKYVVRSLMAYGYSVTVISGVLDINYIRNEGAAFSILQGRQEFLIVFTLAAMIALSVYANHPRFKTPKIEKISMALICGGGLGNLVCRIINGYVTDFLNIHILPVFNVADIAICIGCGLLIFSVFLGSEKKDEAAKQEKQE